MYRPSRLGALALLAAYCMGASASPAAPPEDLNRIRTTLSNPPHRPMPLQGGFGVGRVYEIGGIRVELTDAYTLVSIPANPDSGQDQRHYIDFGSDGVPDGVAVTSGPVNPSELSMVLDELRQQDTRGLESALHFGSQRARREDNSPFSLRDVVFLEYGSEDTTATSYDVGHGERSIVTTSGNAKSTARSIVKSVQTGYDRVIAALKTTLRIQ